MNPYQSAAPPRLDDLASFAAVVDCGGFSAAARRLGVSKTQVSAAVGRLEARLGVRLLQRTTRRLSLTEAGSAVLPHAQQAALAARDAEEAATALRATPRGRLRVNAPMSFGLLQVAPALGDFTRRFPEVEVDLVLDDRRLDLVDGGFDLAVRIGELADSSLVATHLGHNHNLLVASPDYLARRGPPQQPEDLASHAALIYTLSAARSDSWSLQRDGDTREVRVGGPLRANNSLALRDAALQGLGIARLPAFCATEALRDGRLVPVLPGWSLPSQGIHALTTARRQRPPKVAVFIDFLRGRFAALGTGKALGE